MKSEKLLTMAQSFLMSFLLSFGAVGCMVTGLNLNAELGHLAVLCLIASVISALAGRLPFGGWLLSLSYLGAALYLWRSQEALDQTVDMLCHISRFYDHAYGWGYILSPRQGQGLMEIPLGILALWISSAVSWAAQRGEGSPSALLLSAVPLMACVVVTDTVPDTQYLFVWLLGFTLLLLSRRVRREDPHRGSRAVLLAALPVTLALGLLFWLVPREGYDKHPDELQAQVLEFWEELPTLWEQTLDNAGSQVDGLVVPESVRLDNTGPRRLGNYPVMTVTSQITGRIYLRGQHFDTYSGTSWTVTGEAQESWAAELESYRDMGTITISTRRNREVIYLPYYPLEAAALDGGRVENTQNEKTYAFTHHTLPMGWQRTLAALTYQPTSYYVHSQEVRQLNLQLPGDTRAWAEALLAEILNKDSTIATEKAEAIAAFVRASARYDLDTRRMPSSTEDFARWFLEESDSGYCVHFATAATVLLRAAGVEARYVEGYTADVRKGQAVTVTADQAHAWCEYYEPLLGAWIPLEATPADQDSAETPQTQPESQPGTDAAPMSTEPQTTPSGPPETQPGDTSQADTPTPDVTEEGPELDWLWRLLIWLLSPLAAFGALEGQRFLRLERRRKQLHRGNSKQRCLARWRQLAQLHRILKTQPPEQARFLAERAKYSPHPIDRQELAVLDEALGAAEAQMGKRPWYLQLVDKYIFCVLE